MPPEGFEPGEEVARLTFEVGANEISLMTAIVRDPNPLHFDPVYVAQQNLPGRVNQGPINASYAVQAALAVAVGPADLRAFSIRYEAFVFEEERVTATAIVEDMREDNGGSMVDLALELTKDDGTVALTGSATVQID